jgi:hypothetical protein
MVAGVKVQDEVVVVGGEQAEWSPSLSFLTPLPNFSSCGRMVKPRATTRK